MNNPTQKKLGRPANKIKKKETISVTVDYGMVDAFKRINEELADSGGKVVLSMIVNNHLKEFLKEQYPGYFKSV